MGSLLCDTLSRRRLVLDGAMGTMIQAAQAAPADGNNDMLVLTNPQVISGIHRQYLEAGADIITTCSFNAQRISQADYNTCEHVTQINLEAARLARAEADKMTARTPSRPRFVVGSVGPTTRLLSIADSTDDPTARKVSFDELEEAYIEQMRALLRGGVDALLVETSLDILNAKAALRGALKAIEIENRGPESDNPAELMLSITVTDASGRILSGHTIEAFSIAMSHIPLLCIGLNCSMGAAAMHGPLRRLKECNPDRFISVHPNAGLPNSLGQYDDTPEMMATEIGRFLDEGIADIVGGCCGTTPEHIKAMAAKVACAPERLAVPKAQGAINVNTPTLAAIEAFTPQEGVFINVGERCNVAGSRKFLRLINEKSYQEAIEIARKQVNDGAMVLDINMDDGLLDAPAELERFIRLISAEPDIAAVPVMIDSSNFDAIVAALKALPGKGIVNSISLKDGEEEFLRRARIIRSLGAAVVVMCFDEEGQATDYTRRIEIARRAYRLLTEQVGMDATDIIIDPNILTVATGMDEHIDYAYHFVEATRWIRANLPGVSVSGGLSNLSFAFRGNNPMREAMHSVFLWRAVQAGMNMAIMNPATAVAYNDIPKQLRDAIDKALFTERTPEAVERLTQMAHEATAATSATAVAEATPTNPSLRLRDAIIKGSEATLADDITILLNRGDTPLEIISGPLMEGINEVGTRFGEGKMFLPQVVKTARAMKCAVDILRPHFGAGTDASLSSHYAGSILIATVKGDVHDIGKNIVSTILTCNNYKVHDLGVMVAPEDIVAEAKRLNPDIICLSGLITPSLEYMCQTAAMLADAGIDTPLMIGGATTSAMHTAVKIAPLYRGVVIHMKDAAQNPIAAARLLDPESRESFIAEIRQEQSRLREQMAQRDAMTPTGADEEALRHRVTIDWKGYKPLVPTGSGTSLSIPLPLLREYIDWRYFYHAWKLRTDSPEANQLRAEAESLLDTLAIDQQIGATVYYRFVKAQATDGAIVCQGETITTRRKRYDAANPDGECPALCDFVSPEADTIGVFAATITEPYRRIIEQAKSVDATSPRSLMLQTLADRIVEAAAEMMHQRLSQEYGFKGIRPAVGYPSLPGQDNIFRINNIIGLEDIGITLTETGAMYPQASIAGLIITHPQARYF